VDGSERPTPSEEVCNGLDDDLDGEVDEPFRDERGRYVGNDHCGACGASCAPMGMLELAADCTLLDESPVCAATRCVEGYGVSSTGRCVSAWDHLCLACVDDADCGQIPTARCSDVGGEARCTTGCEFGCPHGYACIGDACQPMAGSCACEPGDSFTLACAITDVGDTRCVGSALCEEGVLSACMTREEVCDEVDNDCDGTIDEEFRDRRGAYILDIHHCGECGVDCTLSEVPEGDLICGGDPFAPTCVLDCPDARDGIHPGDRIDADRAIGTGCECTVSEANDLPGPVGAEESALDVNCDGADGIVLESFYVAADGNDGGPGSPSRPLRSISVALQRALESLESDEPRPHFFIAAGAYTETLVLPDGVQLHGGYRRDFRALDPNGFRVEVRAPADTDAPGGAALQARNAGLRPTVVEWLALRGLDAVGPSAPAFGVYVLEPGPLLAFRNVEIRAGVAGTGVPGPVGEAGAPPTAEARSGDVPRAAVENDAHRCLTTDSNAVRGGEGGSNTCGDREVSGGNGGSSECPAFSAFQPSGAAGRAAGAVAGGAGGTGGQDSRGPITGLSCSLPVCCGLADFSVPTEFTGPQSGLPGADGSSGRPGIGCSDPLGSFDGDRWLGDTPTGGTDGTAGSGAGGGGAGGGTEMEWFPGQCEFRDGLGGGGGGGGAGGCGGRAGGPASSGGPSVAMLIRVADGRESLPALDQVTLAPSDGGRGGDGGAGGDGGLGGTGAFGGALSRAERSTPTLAGPFPGGRGGKGGNGGSGGGGGGGCGGGSIGIWLTGVGDREPPDAARWRTANTFRLARGGGAGLGGGGAAAAADGVTGGARDVVVR